MKVPAAATVARTATRPRSVRRREIGRRTAEGKKRRITGRHPFVPPDGPAAGGEGNRSECVLSPGQRAAALGANACTDSADAVTGSRWPEPTTSRLCTAKPGEPGEPN